MIADRIVHVLNQFIKSKYDRIIFDGKWGIGKTKHVDDFVKDNSEISCYVSLFGKKSLKEIIEEIYYKSLQANAKGKFKEYFSKSAKKMEEINLSYFGLSLSIPMLADLYSKMFSELEEKQSYIIIFDDIERKHDELEIKELLGLIDLLGNIKGVKIALVAYTEKFGSFDKEVFTEYKEKSIDRIYCIDKYSENAPYSILGTDEWFSIRNIVDLLEFSNLRTFQKTKNFIAEVLDVLGEDVFIDEYEKFTEDDVYRMCFAIVVYFDEHNSEKLLVDEDIRERFKSESDTIDYIYGYILNHNLDNMMSKNILFHIKNWYETGDYDINSIRKDIDLIKSYNYEKPLNHLSSQDEVLQAISKSKEFIHGIEGDENLDEVIQIITMGTIWANIASVEFKIDLDDLIKKIKPCLLNHVNIDKTLYENEVILKRFASEKENQACEIVDHVNKVITYEYYNTLTDKIVNCFKVRNFNSNHYLKKLMDSVISINDYQPEIMENIINKIKYNNYFFPISTGEISEEEWNWCLLNNVLIRNIEKFWKKEGFYDEYGKYISKKANEHSNFMLQHRVKILKQEIQREFY
ncbi:P-loop NTPase fold protein [Bacillus altitudinis]|uniref:P-loop NTPase fold protein n=1 Tax=Bacillus altitudinis TaxID=293387 RepID=UPI00080AA872|nr:P-loop NTPase fold protein [Bacillus altitudinis]ANT56226.1 hypothetical protein VP59_05260 [Bacillus pumilus]SPR94682.1 conserved hypothetical protein [Bacillus altitudinis]